MIRFISTLAIVFASVLPSFSEEKPNFVLIFIDDMGYGDIEPFGSTANATPNLNKMAAEGMKLTSFYAAPVCSASRAQLLTGSYAPRVSVPGVFFPRQSEGINPDEHTVADYLKGVGYATACVGKWHLGDQREFLPTRLGFDSYFGIPYSNDMQKTSLESGEQVTPLLRDEEVAELLEDEGQRRVTREYAEEAVAFIREKAESDEPFFLYLPHTAMHVPLFPHEDFVGASENGVYGDWVAEVDWSVGQILDVLEELAIEENTLVIFTSDNGPWASKGDRGGVSGPLRGSKGGTLEGGVRVPTIVQWKGKIEGGTSSGAVTGTTDVLPTFAALAGAELREDRKIDGYDMSGVLFGEREETEREAWYYFQGTRLQAVRQGPWKYAVTPQSIGMGFKEQPSDIKEGGRLYNLGKEVGETTDLSEENPDIVAKLKALADAAIADLEQNRRPGGFVKNPVMLYPSDALPRGSRGKVAEKIDWSTVKVGDTYATAAAPKIANQPFEISVTVSGKNCKGPIIAHGGSSLGYVLYAKNGLVTFALSHGGNLDRVTVPLGEEKTEITASVFVNGMMNLTTGEALKISESKLIARHPQEDLCIGHDDKNPVDPAAPKGRFTGEIHSARVVISKK